MSPRRPPVPARWPGAPRASGDEPGHRQGWLINADGKLDIPRIKPIARMDYYDYAVVTETFEMRVPGASEAERFGLEGHPA